MVCPPYNVSSPVTWISPLRLTLPDQTLDREAAVRRDLILNAVCVHTEVEARRIRFADGLLKNARRRSLSSVKALQVVVSKLHAGAAQRLQWTSSVWKSSFKMLN